MKPSIEKKVLDFYKILPFNSYGSIDEQTESVLQQPLIEEIYPPLKGLVTKSENILELGCGLGWVTNSVANNYNKIVVGLDFNPKAIEIAKAVSKSLNLKSSFLCQDLFSYCNEKDNSRNLNDLIISLGVLHHTHDCIGAIKSICNNLLKKKGFFFIGLYHRYGRTPFLKYFDYLKKLNLSEEELFVKYKELHGLKNQVHQKSWFRDQVLHPHETLHTIEEITQLLPELRCKLVSTSINKFETIESHKNLIEEEKKMTKISEQKLSDKQYFPGFFVFLLQKE